MRLHHLNWQRPAARAHRSHSTPSFFMERVTSLMFCLFIRLLFIVFRWAWIITVTVTSPNPTVSAVYFSVRSLVFSDLLCHFLGLFLGTCYICCLAVARTLHRPTIWMFHYVLIFSSNHKTSNCFILHPVFRGIKSGTYSTLSIT